MLVQRFGKSLKSRQNIGRRIIKTLALKSFLSHPAVKNRFDIRIIAQKNLHKFQRKGSLTIARNICVGTGRTDSHYRIFSGNRMWIKKMAEYGYLPGIRRAS